MAGGDIVGIAPAAYPTAAPAAYPAHTPYKGALLGLPIPANAAQFLHFRTRARAHSGATQIGTSGSFLSGAAPPASIHTRVPRAHLPRPIWVAPHATRVRTFHNALRGLSSTSRPPDNPHSPSDTSVGAALECAQWTALVPTYATAPPVFKDLSVRLLLLNAARNFTPSTPTTTRFRRSRTARRMGTTSGASSYAKIGCGSAISGERPCDN